MLPGNYWKTKWSARLLCETDEQIIIIIIKSERHDNVIV